MRSPGPALCPRRFARRRLVAGFRARSRRARRRVRGRAGTIAGGSRQTAGEPREAGSESRLRYRSACRRISWVGGSRGSVRHQDKRRCGTHRANTRGPFAPPHGRRNADPHEVYWLCAPLRDGACVPPRTPVPGPETGSSEFGGSVGRDFAANRHFDDRGLFPLAHDRYLPDRRQLSLRKAGESYTRLERLANEADGRAASSRRPMKDEPSSRPNPFSPRAGSMLRPRYWARIHFTRLSASCGETAACGGIGVCPQTPPPPLITFSLNGLTAASSLP